MEISLIRFQIQLNLIRGRTTEVRTLIDFFIFSSLMCLQNNINLFENQLKMISEFDYCAEMEEGSKISPIRATQPVSLYCSRRQNTLSSHRRVLMDLDHYIQESKNHEEKRLKELKNRQKNIGEEISRQQAHKQMKKKQLQDQMKKKKFKECTFKPKTNSSKIPNRTFNQFLENQSAHTTKVNQKKEELRKNIEAKKEKATYHPRINSRRRESRESNSEFRQSPATVFDRLYALKDKQLSQEDENKNTFQPVINERSKNMVRDAPVQELLYRQALRRQSKENNQIIYTSSSAGSKFIKPVNFTNEKYAAQKFIKEFFFALEELAIETSFQSTIDYVMFGEILKSLGFITNDEENESQASSNQRALVHSAYQIISDKKVNARNLCVFLLALLGIYHINPINFEEGDEIDEEQELNLNEVDGRKMQKQFQTFYRNRLSSQENRRPEEKVESFSFQPKINAQSEEMAEKHRSMMLEEANQLIAEYPELEFSIPEDGVISHTDLLVLHKLAKDLEKEKMRQEREDEEMKQCTFKPQTLTSSMNCSKMSISKSGSKCFQLYEYHKELKSKKESMKASRQEIDPQCTFKPQINHQKPLKHPLVAPSKQTDETLYRMYKGRQEHENRQRFLERGEKVKSRNTSIREEEKVPTLILDVNLGEKVDRIVLYPGDEERLEEVAQEFSEKHDLDCESTCKLLEMLKVELQNVLSKIDQDDESEDGDY